MTQYCFAVKRGDTYNGALFTVQLNGAIVDLTDATILIQFRESYATQSLLDLTVGNGVTITNPTGGTFRIDPRVFTMRPGVFKFEIRLTLSTGVIKTWIGGTANIIEDIARG